VPLGGCLNGWTGFTMTNANVRILMCAPRHYAVTYTINPWMEPATWAPHGEALAATSRQEWRGLVETLRDLGATIETKPDLVFTANAAVVLDRIALLARFRHPERRREEPHVRRAFEALQARGLIDAIETLPDGIVLEGAGDCVFDEARNLFWMGYGPRSDAAAQQAVEDVFGVDVVALELADPRFYHVDTALSPLPGGDVMYVPEAFTAAAHAALRARVPADRLIAVGLEDASRLAANAVAIGDALVMSGCGDELRDELDRRGYRVVATPLSSFLRSGGAAFCLTLRLDRRSAGAQLAATRAVASPARLCGALGAGVRSDTVSLD
jgi:N-dimethylarginine dimethylaminohydrolase